MHMVRHNFKFIDLHAIVDGDKPYCAFADFAVCKAVENWCGIFRFPYEMISILSDRMLIVFKVKFHFHCTPRNENFIAHTKGLVFVCAGFAAHALQS